MKREPWHLEARCRDLAPAQAERLFFAPGPTSTEAMRMCVVCPVKALCRAETDRAENGLRKDYIVGFRAGETGPQRVERRKREAESA